MRVEATNSPLAAQLESPAATLSRPELPVDEGERHRVDLPARIAPQQDAPSSPHRLLDEHRTKPAIVPPLVPDLVIQSEYAGLFFLLNVFIAMELYSDFTSPVQKGLDCNLWQFLRLVVRALTGEDIEDDPVWPFLEALTGEDERPIDAEWLDGLVAQIRERLSIFESPDFLIKRFARVTTSPAHVDVYFSLPAHPIEIRMAGLDRDPGWMPAASRHVTFHFD